MRYGFKCNQYKHEFILITNLESYLNALYFECPKCKSCDVKRMYDSPPSVHFIGKDFTKSVNQEDE